MNNLDFDISVLLNVKCNVAVDFRLVSNSKHISTMYLSRFSCYTLLVIWMKYLGK